LIDNTNNRVVVTGIGVLSPLGLTVSDTWTALIDGRSGIDYITLFDTEGFETKIAGEVKGFDAADYINRKDARRMDRFAQLGVAAAVAAVEDAGLKIDDTNRYDIGVLVGSGAGGLITLQDQMKNLLEQGPGRVSPFLAPMLGSDTASANISIVLGAKGPNFCTTSACSSSADAVGTAYETVKRGDASVMLGGGSEAIICPIGIAAFNANRALSTRNDDPQKASRPFDLNRDGFIISEGGTILVLENLDYARARGAEILGEIVSYGASGDAYHITQPHSDGEGAIRAMHMALQKAGLQPTDVNYINAHGTSTSINDRVETMAIKQVFGEHAYKIPVSSTKSMTGHLIGGAGALEAAITIMILKNGTIPPTINYTDPDPDCDLDYVPNTARQAETTFALSNSFGFGGHNAVLAFRKYTEE
jgi:3-oxoacyl-[acyl-carrier-protein] synthase II